MDTITLAEGGTAKLPPVEKLAGSNCGAKGVWRFDSGQPGPHVLVTALVHGNEVCGPMALAHLLDEPPRIASGRLALVFCNLEAYARITDASKADCRLVDEDLNRVWGRVDTAEAATCELRRARELLPHVSGADVLLDLHSMTQPAPALGLVGRAAKNIEMARRIGYPGLLVQDAGHAAGLRLIDRPPYGDPAAAPVAMLVECGEHFSRVAFDAAREAVDRTLAAYLGGGTLAAPLQQTVIEVTQAVTIETDEFVFVRDWPNMALVPEGGTLVGRDGGREVRTPHDDTYLVMPATAAFRQRGQTAVRFARRAG
jgi:predicted deacylase